MLHFDSKLFILMHDVPDHVYQGDVDTTRMSPWLLRIEMARDMMVDKKLLLSEVAERINR